MEHKFKFVAKGKSGTVRVKLEGVVFAQDAEIAANLALAVVAQQHPGFLPESVKVRKATA